MKKYFLYNISNIATIIIVAMLFSCNDSLKQVQKIGISENEPIGIDYNMNVKYTDSGRVTANLLSAKMLDYSNRDFPFHEFRDGVTLYIFDKDNKKSTVVADNAIVYGNTDLIDMRGHVVITTYDNSIIKSDQLYYDNDKGWLFTNHFVELSDSDGTLLKGNVFDANSKFTDVNLFEAYGNVMLEE